MNERIKFLHESSGLSLTAWAEMVGVSVDVASRITNNKVSASIDTVLSLLKAYPSMNPNWLLFGQGPQYAESIGRVQDAGIASEPQAPYTSAAPSAAAHIDARIHLHITTEQQLDLFRQLLSLTLKP